MSSRTESLTPGAAAPSPCAPTSRLESVDLLRGIVIVLMALDHTRDFFHSGIGKFDPLDLTQSSAALFFTRWITHFCAPVFVFLAGTGAFLSGTRGKSKADLSRFLFTRGLWLVLLEITWVKCLGWNFNFDYHEVWLLVIWAIGWSMVVLAALIHLPVWAVTAFGLIMIVGHNALDNVKPESWGPIAGLWRMLHAGGPFEVAPGYKLGAGYPLIPWTGVMAVGYSFGAVLQRPPDARRRWMLRAGLGLVALFIVLRFSNIYGDPGPWSHQPGEWLAAHPITDQMKDVNATSGLLKSGAFKLFSFLDCHKYPPSLCYLLMTLGPALIVLSFLDRGSPRWLQPMLVFGRVPLFFYLVHLPLIHAFALAANLMRFGRADWLYGNTQGIKPPENAGFNLLGVYLAWITVVMVLYPACRWFADLKRRRREAWLSYL